MERLTRDKLPELRAEVEEIASRPEVARLVERINAELADERSDEDSIKTRWFKIGDILLEAKSQFKLDDDEFKVAVMKSGLKSVTKRVEPHGLGQSVVPARPYDFPESSCHQRRVV